MPLSSGDKLGPYEILAAIGAGGMGEVYRARDTRLGRDVAIKVSNEKFSDRFGREARVIASLNHPNICSLYDVGDDYLVMEFIDGPTLDERIRQGALPLDEALAIARQIADALDAAHQKGIVHRDLKPANIKVSENGSVKVLDFGLAKISAGPAAPDDPSASPTRTLEVTLPGIIVGTAAYMAPEQARGKPADKRVDIWAFGVVLYEMLTGRRLFDGETTTDVLAAVVKLEPEYSRVPPQVRRVLKSCLAKDPKKRLRDIGDAWGLLEETGEGRPVPARISWIPWTAAAVLAVMAGISLWGWLHVASPEPRKIVRLTTTLPVAAVNGAIALSRDGSRLAFVGGDRNQIHIRMMDQLVARPIPGTEDARFLSFSPDGESLCYVTLEPERKLKKVAIDGGPVQVLADATTLPAFTIPDWGSEDNILVTISLGLLRVPAVGGKSQMLARPDTKKNETAFTGAQLLPGGNHALVGITMSGASPGQGGTIAALNLKTGETKRLIEEASGVARYAPASAGSAGGYIVYYAQGTGSLMAVPFDVGRLEVIGSPVPVLEGVQSPGNGPYALWSISDTGTLVYIAGRPGSGSARSLVWVDRKGAEEALPAPERNYTSANISPDGEHIALGITGERTDIWIYDLARASLHKVTSEQDGVNPIWTPDGKRLVYAQNPGAVAWAPADGSGAPSILAVVEKGVPLPTSVSPDGKLAIGRYQSTGELWVLPLTEGLPGDAKPQAFLDSRSRKNSPAFSPDGHWVAYESLEAGVRDIYVTPYPGPGPKIQISTHRGTLPRWSHDGRELFYRTDNVTNQNLNSMMAVDVETGPPFRVGTPKVLFEEKGYADAYDVSPDGKRFLMVKSPGNAPGPIREVTIVLNWVEELRRLDRRRRNN